MIEIPKEDSSAMHFQNVLEDNYYGGTDQTTYKPLCQDCLVEVLGEVLHELFHWASYHPNIVLGDLFSITALNAVEEARQNRNAEERSKRELSTTVAPV